ncbi:unnamed protein product [Alternaria alternata]
MKRKGVNVSAEAGKRQRTAVKEMREADCVYDRAAPYLLRRLRQIFDEAGVLRRDASHWLQVACSKAQVQQMLDYLKDEGLAQTTATAAESAEGDSKWPSFEGWGSIIGEKAELIAGHHRVEAFKEYLRFRELPEEERWWVNRELEKVLDRDNNKPALQKDLIPALRAKYGDKADKTSRVLEQRILNNVRKNANHFTSITLDHYLHEYPGADGDAYGARFGHKVWRDVLSLVTSFAGPTLQHKYIAGMVLGSTRKISLPAIAQTARDLISQDFIAATKSTSFDGSQAIDMLQKRYTIDYGSRKAGSRAAALEDEYIPSFFLDLLIITENQPAFYTYDYGANIEIDVANQLRAVPKETRLQPAEEESDSEEEAVEIGGSAEDNKQSRSSTPGASAILQASYDYQNLFH